jgi:thiol-disulfide isomerase/thioredoxin
MKLHSLLLPVVLALFAVSTVHAAEDFDARKQEAIKAIQGKRSAGKEAFYAELETQGRAMLKDFPDKEDGYQMLLAVAQNGDPAKQAAIFKELDTPKAPAEVKEAIAGIRAKAEALGKPLDIKFTAIDGRAVDLSTLKGKVVLVDFWATWCGPCVAELPNVKAAYEKLHDKGFEIVGISFDQDKAKLESFVKEKQMAWPQFFDGQGWKNQFGQKFGINSIPAMWLVNKKGNLIDMEGRDGLEAKIEKLLAE